MALLSPGNSCRDKLTYAPGECNGCGKEAFTVTLVQVEFSCDLLDNEEGSAATLELCAVCLEELAQRAREQEKEFESFMTNKPTDSEA